MATRRIMEFLDGNHARYVLISHSPAYTAQEVAESMHLPGRYMAKTVIVGINGRLAMAVVPATKEVDLDQLAREVGTDNVVVAGEDDFRDKFAGCQTGTAPPFGVLFGVDTYLDRDLAKQEYIAFNAGTHTDAISMRFQDYRRLAHPRLAKIAAEPGAKRPQFVQL